MKKMLAAVLLCILIALVLSTALAVQEGAYDWNGHVLTVTKINEKPMFAPGDMTVDQRPVGISFQAPAAILADDALSDQLYAQAKLVDGDGTAYAPGAATSKDDTLTYYFGIPKDADMATFTIQFVQETGIPAEYVGEWSGSAGGIDLSFSIGPDGTGSYTFVQGRYTETYDVTMSAASETFTVNVPQGNASNIATCEGTYAYADDVLTLQVKTTFVGGKTFSYEIPCKRVVK